MTVVRLVGSGCLRREYLGQGEAGRGPMFTLPEILNGAAISARADFGEGRG